MDISFVLSGALGAFVGSSVTLAAALAFARVANEHRLRERTARTAAQRELNRVIAGKGWSLVRGATLRRVDMGEGPEGSYTVLHFDNRYIVRLVANLGDFNFMIHSGDWDEEARARAFDEKAKGEKR